MASTGKLHGKIAIITGAAQGMGWFDLAQTKLTFPLN